jgi:hypothetical protein
MTEGKNQRWISSVLAIGVVVTSALLAMDIVLSTVRIGAAVGWYTQGYWHVVRLFAYWAFLFSGVTWVALLVLVASVSARPRMLVMYGVAAALVFLVSIFNLLAVSNPAVHRFLSPYFVIVVVSGAVIYAFLLLVLIASTRVSKLFLVLAGAIVLYVVSLFLDPPVALYGFDLSDAVFDATSIVLLSQSLKRLRSSPVT